MRKTKKIMAALLTAAMVIGSLTGCGGGNSATSTNDKGEIAELINAVQPESGEYDPAGAAAYEYFSVQTNCYEGFVRFDWLSESMSAISQSQVGEHIQFTELPENARKTKEDRAIGDDWN